MTSDQTVLPAWCGRLLAAFLLALLIWPTRAQARDTAPLQRAIIENDLTRVRLLLAQGADPSEPGLNLDTPVHEAAREGRYEILKLLLDRGGRPDQPNDLDQRPLYLAAVADNAECCRLLLARGAEVDAETTSGWTALYAALVWGKEHASLVLLEAGAAYDTPASYGATLGETPLMTASRRGPLVVAKALLERGADPHRRDQQGRTALHYAALGNEPEIASLLLKTGLSADQTDAAGESAWAVAAKEGGREVADLLLERLREPAEALLAACYWGAPQDVRSLLGRGVRPEGPEFLIAVAGRWDDADFDDRWISARDATQRREDTRLIARMLLEAGASPSVDALSRACQARNPRVAELLLAAGVSPMPADSRGDYPLLRAAERGDSDLVKRLLEAGADPAARDAHGLGVAERMANRAAILEALLGEYSRSRALRPEESGTRASLERLRREGPLIAEMLKGPGKP